MAGIRWDINTHGKTQATLAGPTELRVVDDPSGAINSKKTTLTALAAFIKTLLGLASTDISDFTEAAQDATGAMVANSVRVSLAYIDATPSLTADLVSNSVTASYLHSGAAHTLFGNSTGAAGAGQDITLGAGLAFVGTTLTSTITQYTDAMAQAAVRVANSFDIANLHFSATARLAGRTTAGAGGGEEISIGTGLALAAGTLSSTITQYTDEMAQDAVGTILTDTAEVDFTYNDAGNTITADLKTNSVVLGRLVNATQRAMVAASGSGAWVETALSANVFTMLGSANNAAIISNIGAVNITGDSMTGPLQLSQSTSTLTQTDAILRIISTDAGVDGPTFVSYHNSASPAASDVISRYRAYGNNASAAAVLYASYGTTIVSTVAGAEVGRITLSTVGGGVFAGRLRTELGVYHPSATGGDKGDNTLNFGTLYQNNHRVATRDQDNVFSIGQSISGSSAFFLAATFVSTENSASAGPYMLFDRLRASPTAGDTGGTMLARFNNSSGTVKNMTGFQTRLISPTAGAETGAIDFFATVAGTSLAIQLSLSDGALIGSGAYKGFGTLNLGSALYVNGNFAIRANGDLQNAIYTLATLPTPAAGSELAAVSDASGMTSGGSTGAALLVSTGASGKFRRVSMQAGVSVLGDAALNYSPLTNGKYLLQATTLTADRTITLKNADAVYGDVLEVNKTSAGNFALIVANNAGTELIRFPGGTNLTSKGTIRFYWDGTDWQVFGQPEVTGTYQPTLTNVLNVAASTTGVCLFTRVGDTVSVFGSVSIDPTAATTLTTLGISLPITSNLGAATDLAGTMGGPTAAAATSSGGRVEGDATNDRASLTYLHPNAANNPVSFQFMYRVI